MMVSAVGITSDVFVQDSEAASPFRVGRATRPASCFVVTGNARLRERLQAVADIAEWPECVAPADADELGAAADADHRLVVIDIAEPCGDRVSDSLRLAEEFVARPGTLVVVCGSGESVEEELWARQLGAWLYLPGVSGGDCLVEAFVEARRVTGLPNRMRQYA
jgi:hypothetical protein